MPALSRKNSGKEAEGKEKGKKFIGKSKVHAERCTGELRERVCAFGKFKSVIRGLFSGLSQGISLSSCGLRAFPGGLETGWDLGPFLAVLAPGQTSP